MLNTDKLRVLSHYERMWEFDCESSEDAASVAILKELQLTHGTSGLCHGDKRLHGQVLAQRCELSDGVYQMYLWSRTDLRKN